jgi:hypothetical protein
MELRHGADGFSRLNHYRVLLLLLEVETTVAEALGDW